jgi:hypothetical protein
VIDLGRGDDVLVPPQWYFEVANPEDRLFVPADYVPLFVERDGDAGNTRPDDRHHDDAGSPVLVAACSDVIA